jgi:hypothetical protein
MKFQDIQPAKEDNLKDISYLNICGCDCFKRNWKYYRKGCSTYLGLTYLEAELRMREIIGNSKFNVAR